MEEMEEIQNRKPLGWGIVELLGHKVIAGFLTEDSIAGTGFIRVDVPAMVNPDTKEEIKAFAKICNPVSIYTITPVDQETAIQAAWSLQLDAVGSTQVVIPHYRSPLPEPPEGREYEWLEGETDDDDDDEPDTPL